MDNNNLDPIDRFRQFAHASRSLCQALAASGPHGHVELLTAIYSALTDFPDPVYDDDEIIGILDAFADDVHALSRYIVEPSSRFLLTLGFAHIRRYKRVGAPHSLERALLLSNSALTLISRDGFPRLWAFAQLLAGDSKRLLVENTGDRALDPLEHYSKVLDVIRREDDPSTWATIALRLGREYQIRETGDRHENLRRAADIIQEVLVTWREAGSVQGVAESVVALGDVRVALNRDNQDLQIAVEYYRQALELFRRMGDLHSAEAVALKIRALETVDFSAYYPRTVLLGRRYGLVVYAHLPELQGEICVDIQKFSEELGDTVPTPRRSRDTAKLARDTLVTVVPECPHFRFDPPELTKRWNGNWTRFPFDFEVQQELIGEVLIFRISVQVAGIEVASISNCAIEVTESAVSPVVRTPIEGVEDNPLARAKVAIKTSALYQKIFVSYSRRDREVTERYKLAQVALGNEAFIDVESLRAGEDWKAGLARAIDRSDVFQLFWSINSATSEHCRYEWTYALQVRSSAGRCEGFIRPVFWQKPMPDPPPELKDLNFRYVPLAG